MESDRITVEDRDAFVLGAVTDPANRPAVYHGSPAARAFNAAYDEMEQKYPKRKDQKKAGIDLAVVGWKAVDAMLAESTSRLATLTRERDEAVALAARRLEQFNEQTRLAAESWKESDVALAAMRASRDEAWRSTAFAEVQAARRALALARTALAEARGLLNPSILRCVNFHHAKKDRHEAGVECPCEVRAFALLARIDALAGEGGA